MAECCPLRRYQSLLSPLVLWTAALHQQLCHEEACYLRRSYLCRTDPLRQHSVLGSDMSLFKLADVNAVVLTSLPYLCYPHPQSSHDGTNTLMGAYQGKTIISDFQRPVAHSLTKKQVKGMKKWVLGGNQS